MRWYIDTEFHERGHAHPLDLISIALVSQSGIEYYAISSEFDLGAAEENAWLAKHVLPKLPPVAFWKTREQIARDIRRMVASTDETPEFWGYFADYDWVLLCQLFGSMLQLPDGWPMFCMDFKQRMVECSITRAELPEMAPGAAHDALEDARWLKTSVLLTDTLGR